ncbi:hypothetical protein, partial [Staphylococcus epidermidis]
YSDNILVKLFISEIVHTKDSFLLKLYYKFNFATEPLKDMFVIHICKNQKIMVIYIIIFDNNYLK